jgi:fermentation-respiration switch protein FrsA (DUF1100 family)
MRILSLLLTLLCSCESRLYQPETEISHTPKEYSINYQEGFITHKNNQIKYWFMHSKSKNKKNTTIMHFHGNSHNIGYHLKQTAWLTKQGYDVFVFDYPGFGKSTGELSKKNLYHSSLPVVEYAYNLHKLRNNKKFILFGQSLGGNISLTAAANSKYQENIDALIIDSTFVSYEDVAFDTLKRHWQTYLISPLAFLIMDDKFSAIESLNKLTVKNVLITHGELDTVIPPKFAKISFDSIKANNKKIKIFEGAKHIGLFYKKENKKFFLDYLGTL